MTVVSGSAHATQHGSVLQTTTSGNAVLNWNSFNIPAGDTTVFRQPSANSIVFNNIGGANPSAIFGTLRANGIVVLENQHGFYFGPNAFVKAGGLLMAGADPTGNGGTLAGFGDQRNIELLVEGGFTPVEAIQIATYNGAKFLGEQDRIGTVAAGKQADLVVIDGNPAAAIAAIRRVKLVFKDGAGYDPAKLLDSVKGEAGMH